MKIKLATFFVGAVGIGAAITAASGCMALVGTDTYTTDAGTVSSTASSGGSSIASSGGSSIARGSSDAGLGEAMAGSGDGGLHVEAGTGVCAAGINDLNCATCWKSACCDQYATCLADSDCASLVTCVQGCTTPPCACTAPTTASLLAFQGLINCTLSMSQPGDDAGSACSFCPVLGIGDPCVNTFQCVSGSCFIDPYCTSTDSLLCASWCAPTLGCSSNADCSGAFAGMNGDGFSNACVTYDNAGSTGCFPECDPAVDAGATCASSYGGGDCNAGVDLQGNAVSICK